MDIKKEYERWLANATADADVVAELKTLDDAKIEDAFYRDLAFGTGGLRGVIGAGTNRMNVYTVAKASQGLADYLKKNFAEPSVAIGYDSRMLRSVMLTFCWRPTPTVTVWVSPSRTRQGSTSC